MNRSYAQGLSQQPLLGDTIGENLARTARRFPDREALVVRSQGVRLTYRELEAQVRVVARGLMARGLAKGDRVGIWAPNRVEWVLLQYATATMGAILVNINPAYKTAELEHALRQSEVGVLLSARTFRTSSFAAMIDEVRGRCPALREVIILEDGWQALLDGAAAVSEAQLREREATLEPDDPINIQYTSGTTGFPKGATLTHHNIVNNGYFVGQGMRLTEADRVCIPVPFYHCFGMVLGNMACSTHGAAMIIPGESFDALAVLEAVTEERCTALHGVPTMFISMLDHPRFGEFSFSTLRTGIMAGSPCPVEVMKKVQSQLHMPEVTICYGMTETSPVSTQTGVDDPIDKRTATVGRVHPHVEVKIIDPSTGRVVPRGSPGELCTRGYSVMLAYWNDPEATRRSIDSARWMHTGDLATMDELGYVNIVGRIKDMIIRGGENIFPREIEEFLYTHPAVSAASVIGVPSEKYGEEVMAWVRTKPGQACDAAALDAFCRGKIATYKIPRYWKFVETFPSTVTGKIQKFKMREASVEELGLQRAAATKTA